MSARPTTFTLSIALTMAQLARASGQPVLYLTEEWNSLTAAETEAVERYAILNHMQIRVC